MARRSLALIGILIVLMVFLLPARSQAEPTDVPMFRGDPARTGVMPGPPPAPPGEIVERWSFNTEDVVISSPAIVEGVAYVTCRDGNLYAVDVATGLENWRFFMPDSHLDQSSPAVTGGMVYFGSGNGNVYALDAATGLERWHFTTDGSAAHSSPAVVDGLVYIGSLDTLVYALDARTGKKRWSFETGDWVKSSPAVVDGVVYVGNSAGSLFALEADTGEERWRAQTLGYITTAPAVADGVIYVGSEFSTDLFANFYVLDAVDAQTGTRLWRYQTQAWVIWWASAPAVSNGMVYVDTLLGLVALDAANGTARWQLSTTEFIGGGGVVLANGVVFYSRAPDKSTTEFDAVDAVTGEILWHHDRAFSEPAVVDGVIYGGSGYHLVALAFQHPAFQVGATVFVAEDATIIRAAPAESAYVRGVVNAGEAVVLTGEPESGWWPVQTTSGMTGWLYEAVLTPEPLPNA